MGAGDIRLWALRTVSYKGMEKEARIRPFVLSFRKNYRFFLSCLVRRRFDVLRR
jgi:hypothetical protein